MISGIPLIFGLGARMRDPDVYVSFWARGLSGATVARHAQVSGRELEGLRVWHVELLRRW